MENFLCHRMKLYFFQESSRSAARCRTRTSAA
jgi:hypothetical protein